MGAIMQPMFYVRRGEVPHKRHTQFRRDDGGLYAEELFGVEGFSGRASLLYHHTPPTQTHAIEKVRDVVIEQSADEASGPHRHRLVNTKDLEPSGDGVTGRVPLFYNSDVTFGVALPSEPMERYYRNGEADEMYFVHEGTGTLETNFGPIDYGPGDYLVLPIGTTFRLRPADGSAQRMLWVESPSSIVPPKRYRNDFGQLLEHSPYCERDIRPPAEMPPILEDGDFVIEVKTRGKVTAYHYRHHPFDLVGWDGHLWPFAFNIGDFEPITGRVHQPPPVHLTFQPRNYVICSFVPRKFDYHPLAIPAPYNHSNINSRRGHLLRRRQLHEPPRRRHQLLHHPPGRHPARPASGERRGEHRQGGDGGAGGHDRHVPSAAPDEAGIGARGRSLSVLLDPARGFRRARARALRAGAGGLPGLTRWTTSVLTASWEPPREPGPPARAGRRGRGRTRA